MRKSLLCVAGALSMLAGFTVPGFAEGVANGELAAGLGTAGTLPPTLAGLGRYVLSDGQLARVRGGFALPNGITFSFGFQQITKLGETVVQSILVPEISNLGNGIPVYVVGGVVTLGGGASVRVPIGAASGQNVAVSVNGSSGPSQGTTGGSSVIVGSPTTNSDPSDPSGSSGDGSPSGTKYLVPASTGTIIVSTTVAGTNGQGATSIQTTLGSNGVLSGISNTLSNQVITQTTEMDISLGGLAASVAAERAAQSILNSATQGFGIH
ncbi:MAG: hypothetical protein ACREFP_12600 [Acetobacteraceae bacterium]